MTYAMIENVQNVQTTLVTNAKQHVAVQQLLPQELEPAPAMLAHSELTSKVLA